MYLSAPASRLRHVACLFALGWHTVPSANDSLPSQMHHSSMKAILTLLTYLIGVLIRGLSLFFLCLSPAHFSASLTRSLFSPSRCAFGGRARPKCPTQRYLSLSSHPPSHKPCSLSFSHGFHMGVGVWRGEAGVGRHVRWWSYESNKNYLNNCEEIIINPYYVYCGYLIKHFLFNI